MIKHDRWAIFQKSHSHDEVLGLTDGYTVDMTIGHNRYNLTSLTYQGMKTGVCS